MLVPVPVLNPEPLPTATCCCCRGCIESEPAPDAAVAAPLLLLVVLVLMCNYVLLVFVRRPFKVFGKSRIKLAIAGVGGVQVSPAASL